ncbi:MAG: tetratricopeptide repeat protein [Pseudomonadota bacterium]
MFEEHVDRAQAHLDAGNPEKARLELRNALRIDPTSIDASLLAADVAEGLGEWRAASNYYQNVLQYERANAVAAIGLARIHVMAGQPEQALTLCNRVLLKSPEHLLALTTHASALAQQRAYAAALVDINTVLRLDPGNEEGVALMAYLMERNGHREAALNTLKEGIEARPDSVRLLQSYSALALAMQRIDIAVEAQRRLVELNDDAAGDHYRLAQLLLRDGRASEAEQTLRQRLSVAPDDQTAQLFLAEALARQERFDDAGANLLAFLGSTDDVPEFRLLLASIDERKGNVDGALRGYRNSIEELGDHPVGLVARKNVARILVGRGEYDAARQLLDEVLVINPRDADGLALSGYLQLHQGDAQSAVADLRLAARVGGSGYVPALLAEALWVTGEQAAAIAELRASEGTPGATQLLALYLFEAGEFEESERRTDELLTAQPESLTGMALKVRHALRRQQADEAALHAASLVAAAPGNPLGYHLAARAALAQGNAGMAEQQWRRALALAPNAIEPLRELVDRLLADARYEDARLLLENTIAQSPKHALAHHWLGRVAVKLNDARGADGHFTRARQLKPDWAEPWLWQARLARALGQEERADALIRDALEHAGARPSLVAERARVTAERGDVDGAITAYRELLQAEPEAPQLLNNLAMLLLEADRDSADLTEAVALVERLDAGEDPRLLDTVGQVLARACKLPRAARAHRSALRYDPDNALYQLRLAAVLVEQGEFEQARLTLSPVHAEALPDTEQTRLRRLRTAIADGAAYPANRCESSTTGSPS